MPTQKVGRWLIFLALRGNEYRLIMMLIVLPSMLEFVLDALADFHAPIFRNSWVRARDDVFVLDRLVDAAANIGITVRTTATRPYRHD